MSQERLQLQTWVQDESVQAGAARWGAYAWLDLLECFKNPKPEVDLSLAKGGRLSWAVKVDF